MRAVTQKHPMGCAIACTASLIGKTYRQTLNLFSHPKYASTRGYYCREICEALKKAKLNYTWKKIIPITKKKLSKYGVIVFVARSRKYPAGHFLLRTKNGWMNSWINYPIKPVTSGFQKKLPGKAQWILFPINL